MRPQRPLWERIARETQIGRRARNILFGLRAQVRENRYTSLEEEGERAHQPVGPG